MPNRSTHQLPQTNTLLAGDRAYLVRETSPGVWVDRSFDPSDMFFPFYPQTVNIEPADIELLHTNPYVIVSAPASDKIIIPRVCVIRFLSWTTPWTSVDLRIGSTQLLNGGRYLMTGPSETGGVTLDLAPFYDGTNLTMIRAGDSLSIEASSAMTGGDAAFSITTYYHLIDA